MTSPILVVRVDDDSPTPLIGEVVAFDEQPDRMWVVWGDLRFTDDAREFAAREFIDDITPIDPNGDTE